MGGTSSSFAMYPTDNKDEDVSCASEASPTATSVPQAIAIAQCSSSTSTDQASIQSTASSYCDESQPADEAQGPSRKRTTIENLPEEVLIKVLAAVHSTASSPLDAVLPSMINRRWRRASRDREVLSRTSRGGASVRARQWCEGAYLFLRRLCESGSLEAAFMLAMILFYCIPGAQFEGGRLLMHSAREGHASSLHAASILSFNGSWFGPSHKDVKMGVALCARAAALGHTDAMRELGHCLLDGYGVQRDTQQGWRMLLEAQAAELALQPFQLSKQQHFLPALHWSCSSPSSSSSAHRAFSPASRRRGCEEFSSPAADLARNASPFGNTMPLESAEQQQAVQVLLAGELRAPLASPSVESASSASSTGAVAGSSTDSDDDVAESTAHASVSRNGGSLVASRLSIASKQVVVEKLLAAVTSGSLRLGADQLKALEPALSVLQTSLLPAPVHPAHLFIREWREMRGEDAPDEVPCASPTTSSSSSSGSACCSSPMSPSSSPPAAAGSSGSDSAAAAAGGVCRRASCGRPETRPLEFWRCSTCWLARYCSRSCQMHDWRERHGEQCCGLSTAAAVAAGAAPLVREV